jgi:uncharacterized membrane protein YgcG
MSAFTELAKSLPTCAVKCLLQAVLESSCQLGDTACVCANPEITLQGTECVVANCTIRDALRTQNLTSNDCDIPPRVRDAPTVIFAVFFGISAAAILLRIVARLQARVPMWWDDLIIGVSFLGCLAFTILGMQLEPKGLGTDIWAVPHDNVTAILHRMYFLFILYITSRDLVRLSILLFYQRIFGQIPIVRPLIRFTFATIVACCIGFVLAIIFGCKPINHFWKGWDGEQEGHCISTHAVFWAGAVIVTVIDIWVMLIPLPFILRLKFSLRKKILSACMFAFGIFVVIVSFYRFSTISKFTLSKNPTYDFVEVGIWSGLELYVGIICACLPHLHSLFKPVYKKLGLSSSDSGRRSEEPSGGTNSSSGGSSAGRHWRFHGDQKSKPDSTIQVTRTIDMHTSESQTHLGVTENEGIDLEDMRTQKQKVPV